MLDRYYTFTTDITGIYKNIVKIRRMEMDKLKLKGTHVTCISILSRAGKGLTAAEISKIAKEDKGGISRALAELLPMGYIEYLSGDETDTKRKYRAKAVLTEKGTVCAAMVGEMITDAICFAGGELDEQKRTVFYEVLGELSGRLNTYVQKLEENKDE